MEVVFDRCCGLDVHGQTVFACVSVPGDGKKRRREIRKFGTTTVELFELADWLTSYACTHVAMESTGVYWKPVFNILDGQFEVILVNAHHMKTVPGRKTDVKDCEWIAQLLEHGLLRASFIPPEPIRALRELTRYRKTQIEERARAANRIQKVLQAANIKLADVATDVLGVSGRQILRKLADGERDPEVLAALARGALQKKHDALVAALTGRMTDAQQFLLAQILDHIEYLDKAIQKLDVRIEEQTRPFQVTVEQVDSITGIGRRSAENILAEIGTTMDTFVTPDKLASWACLCPGNNESAGKRLSGRTRKGNRWLRGTLVECAWSAIRRKATFLSSFYTRLKSRHGGKKAIVAVAHRILVIIHRLLTHGTFFEERGPKELDEATRARLAKHHLKKLKQLGYPGMPMPA